MNLGVAETALAPTVIVVRLPIRIQSEANLRSKWGRIRRTTDQRDVVRIAVASRWHTSPLAKPLQVTLTRIGPRLLDSDNNVAGFKAVRDGVAKAVGVNDGDRALVRWNYGQRLAAKGHPDKYAIEILIESRLKP